MPTTTPATSHNGLPVASIAKPPSTAGTASAITATMLLRMSPPDVRSARRPAIVGINFVSGCRPRPVLTCSRTSSTENPLAAASSIARRISARRSVSRSRFEPSVGCAAATKVPTPLRVSSTPARSRSAYTRATVLAFTRSSTANCRTVGSWAPGANRPDPIAPRMPCSSCAYSGVGCRWSMLSKPAITAIVLEQ